MHIKLYQLTNIQDIINRTASCILQFIEEEGCPALFLSAKEDHLG